MQMTHEYGRAFKARAAATQAWLSEKIPYCEMDGVKLKKISTMVSDKKL